MMIFLYGRAAPAVLRLGRFASALRRMPLLDADGRKAAIGQSQAERPSVVIPPPDRN
jgi:hypothetical protein